MILRHACSARRLQAPTHSAKPLKLYGRQVTEDDWGVPLCIPDHAPPSPSPPWPQSSGLRTLQPQESRYLSETPTHLVNQLISQSIELVPAGDPAPRLQRQEEVQASLRAVLQGQHKFHPSALSLLQVSAPVQALPVYDNNSFHVHFCLS